MKLILISFLKIYFCRFSAPPLIFFVANNYLKTSYSENNTTPYTIVNAMDYYPYGKILREYDNGDGERYLTTAHERDKETGLDYRGARYYDSDVARSLSTDPWANKYPQWSPYNYVMGNPVMLIDPSGKGAESVNGDDKKKKSGEKKEDAKKPEKPKPVQPKYIPPPKELPGFPGAQKLPNKQGMRPGWRLPSGNLGEWDSQHGEVEVYDKTGKKHKGAWDPETGKQIKPPVPGRTATRSKMETEDKSSSEGSGNSNSNQSLKLNPDAAKAGATVGGTVVIILMIVLIPVGI